MSGSAPQSTEDIEVFASACVLMRSIYLHARILFELSTAAQKDIMERAAPIFFADLNRVLIEYTIQQVCKITDPASDVRKNENLAVSFLLQHYDFTSEPETAIRLSDLNEKLKAFRAKLLPARHKLIAHADRVAILSGLPLGAASLRDWNDFWLNLQDLVSTIHAKVVGSALEIASVAIPSDADGLLKMLRHGDCFETLMQGADPVITQKCADLAFPT